MPVRVMAWNVGDAFSNEAAAREVISQVANAGEWQPDVAVFPEAYAEDQTGLLDAVQDDFGRLGYSVYCAPYNDQDQRSDRHGLLGIVRKTLDDGIDTGDGTEAIDLYPRNGFRLCARDPISERVVDVLGVHLDDRSEETRNKQTAALLEWYVRPDRPTVIAGDLNAMHGYDFRSMLIRQARPVARLLPVAEPGTRSSEKLLPRVGSLANRLVEMANGVTMAMLEAQDFRDADTHHRPTIGAELPAIGRLPVAQLDHIMLSREVLCSDFRLGQVNQVSGHRAIMAKLAVLASLQNGRALGS